MLLYTEVFSPSQSLLTGGETFISLEPVIAIHGTVEPPVSYSVNIVLPCMTYFKKSDLDLWVNIYYRPLKALEKNHMKAAC